jgi:hypothetical protein
LPQARFAHFLALSRVLGIRHCLERRILRHRHAARQTAWRTAAALAAAYFLLLQSVFGAFALGAAPQAAQIDAFGNVICTHEGATPGPAEGNRHTIPPCCAFGCLMAAPVLAPPIAAGALSRIVNFEALTFRPNASAHLSFARERSPLNPRAPPLV